MANAADAGTVSIGEMKVNRMGFGAMRLTGEGIWDSPPDVEASKQVLKRAVELGVNFIDTADAYGPEVSENLIHDALYPYKDLIIATKGGMVRGGPGDWRKNGTPEHIKEACAASLKRLGVDQITLYQFHSPDESVPFAESIQAFKDLQDEGQVKYLGLSNVTLELLKKAQEHIKVVSVQNHYNFEHRTDSEDVLNYCEEQGIAFIPYFPIGGGQADLKKEKLNDLCSSHAKAI